MVPVKQGPPGNIPWPCVQVVGKVWIDNAFYDVIWASIRATNTGDNTVIKGTKNQKIRILSIVFTCTGNVDVTFKSGNRILINAMPFAARGGPGINGMPGSFCMDTYEGDDFILSTSNTSDLVGWLTYVCLSA